MSDAMCTSPAKFTIEWRKLSYTVPDTTWSSQKRKILNNISGTVASGQLVGLMGAGGSGKSVLLECLIGKRHDGVSGTINLASVDTEKRKYRIFHIPQTDVMYPTLTARESILFASQIRNKSYSKEQHINACREILRDLNIESCADNLTWKCSGGQQKRISIGMELIARPEILVLDEPTSGLDSAACVSLLKLLSSIAKGHSSGIQISVIISIHQPTTLAYLCMDQVIVLASERGKIMYFDRPDKTESFLSSFGISCPEDDNPANVLMEAASCCFGETVLDLMIRHQDSRIYDVVTDARSMSGIRAGPSHDYTVFPLLCIRWFLILNRDPLILMMRVLASVGNVLCLYLVFEDSGTANTCMRRGFEVNNSTEIITYVVQDFADSLETRSNYILIFAVCLIGFAMSIGPIVFSFITCMTPISREISNNWYSCTSFWLVHMLVEALMTTIVVVFFFILPVYFMTEQEDEFIRLFKSISILLILMTTGQAIYSAAAVALIRNPAACTIFCIVSIFPLCAVTSFSVRFADLPKSLVLMSFCNPVRWAFDSVLTAMYGDDLCGSTHVSETEATNIRDTMYSLVFDTKYRVLNSWALINRSHIFPDQQKDRDLEFSADLLSNLFIGPYRSRKSGLLVSSVVAQFDLEEDDMWKGICFIVTLLCIFRTAGLLILKAKTKS